MSNSNSINKFFNFKKKKDCINFCKLMTLSNNSNSTNVKDCIEDLKKEKETKNCKLCINTVNNNNNNNKYLINSDPGYKKLLILLLRLINYIYFIRYKNYTSKKYFTNEFDHILILSIGKIDLDKFNINLEYLKKIKYPINRIGFPRTLFDYIKIMEELSKNNNKDINFLSKYTEFTSDYQPWLRSLVKFFNTKYSNIIEENYNIKEIPETNKLDDYKKFINIKYYNNINNKNIFDIDKINQFNINSINKFQKNLIDILSHDL
jgi:hypothetical protein